jgi:hypothetical protein
VGGTVPPDLLCIRDGQDVVNLVAQICSVAVNLAQIPGGTDSIAQLALETANIALSTAQAAQAAIPQRRSSTTPVAVPAGDSVMPITWSPAMNNPDYEVRLTLYGPNSAATQFYGYRVIDATRTVNGCSVRLDNMPAGTTVSFVVEALTPTP